MLEWAHPQLTLRYVIAKIKWTSFNAFVFYPFRYTPNSFANHEEGSPSGAGGLRGFDVAGEGIAVLEQGYFIPSQRLLYLVPIRA